MYVIYHSGCADGTIAGWCVYHFFRRKQPYFIPASQSDCRFRYTYNGNPKYIDMIRDQEVIILDLDLEMGTRDIVEVASKVIVIDHHNSSRRRLNELACTYSHKLGYIHCSDGIVSTGGTLSHLNVYDSDLHSCASLSWYYFSLLSSVKNDVVGAPHQQEPMPELLKLISLRDVWKQQLVPECDNIVRAVHREGYFKFHVQERFSHTMNDVQISYYNSMRRLSSLIDKWEKERYRLHILGDSMIKYREGIIMRSLRKAKIGYIIERAMVGSRYHRIVYTYATTYHSDIGDELLKRYDSVDMSITWRYTDKLKENISLSLRCLETSNMDLSMVSKSIYSPYTNTTTRGGGHAKAAGAKYKGGNINDIIIVNKDVVG